jgi:hypothetical protein
MGTHGEAIYGTWPEGIYPEPNQGPCYQYGMFTCRGKTAYFILFYYPGDYVIISKVGPEILSAELMTSGESLTVESLSNSRWKISGLPETPPDDLAPVIRLEFAAPPYRLEFSGADWLEGRYKRGTGEARDAGETPPG